LLDRLLEKRHKNDCYHSKTTHNCTISLAILSKSISSKWLIFLSASPQRSLISSRWFILRHTHLLGQRLSLAPTTMSDNSRILLVKKGLIFIEVPVLRISQHWTTDELVLYSTHHFITEKFNKANVKNRC
jgi:hypothetical protein